MSKITTRENGNAWTFDSADRAERNALPFYVENWQARHFSEGGPCAGSLAAERGALIQAGLGNSQRVADIANAIDLLAPLESNCYSGPRCPHCSKLLVDLETAQRNVDAMAQVIASGRESVKRYLPETSIWYESAPQPQAIATDCKLSGSIVVDQALSSLFDS